MFMDKNQELARVAAEYRKALNYWIETLDLTVDGWCKKAGLTESALRHFLSGTSNSLLASSVYSLAHALGMTVGQLLREEYYSPVDEDVMQQIVDAMHKAEKITGKSFPLAEGMAFVNKTYNHMMEKRMHGEDIAPTEAVFAMLLKKQQN